jgi:precorrin-2/cobalt-factor-2 C20-methyltransferase
LEWNRQLDIEIVPGISSINAAAARTHTSLALGGEKIAVLPALYAEDLKELIDIFDTVVLLKVHRVFRKVVNMLDQMRLTRNTVYVARAGMADERVVRDVTTLKEEDMDYFSVLIVKK